MKLTPETARLFRTLLNERFPWVGSDEPVSGSDVIQGVVDFDAMLAQYERGTGPEVAR